MRLALLLLLVACTAGPAPDGRWIEATEQPTQEATPTEAGTPLPIAQAEYLERGHVRGYYRDRLVVSLDGQDHYVRMTRLKGKEWRLELSRPR